MNASVNHEQQQDQEPAKEASSKACGGESPKLNAYEQKIEAKRERLLAAAERAEASAHQAFRRADLREEVSGIPFGQPILVGHHSERRHRRAIERANAALGRGVAEQKRAEELRHKAAAVGTGGISSFDGDAGEKIAERIAELEASQARMKAANAAIRKHAKAGRDAHRGELQCADARQRLERPRPACPSVERGRRFASALSG